MNTPPAPSASIRSDDSNGWNAAHEPYSNRNSCPQPASVSACLPPMAAHRMNFQPMLFSNVLHFALSSFSVPAAMTAFATAMNMDVCWFCMRSLVWRASAASSMCLLPMRVSSVLAWLSSMLRAADGLTGLKNMFTSSATAKRLFIHAAVIDRDMSYSV